MEEAAIEAVPEMEQVPNPPVKESVHDPHSTTNTLHEIIDGGEQLFHVGKNLGGKIFRLGSRAGKGLKMFSRFSRKLRNAGH